jgi:hypothetical protein
VRASQVSEKLRADVERIPAAEVICEGLDRAMMEDELLRSNGPMLRVSMRLYSR